MAEAALAARLRDAFDSSFAAPPPQPATDLRDFLQLWVGAECYAVALDEMAAIIEVTRIIALPCRAASLLGVMGHKGEPVFVHDIAALMGLTCQAPPRRLLLAASDPATGFAFEKLGPWLKLGNSEISALDEGGGPVRAVAMTGGQRRPILSLKALLQSAKRSEET